MTPQQPAIANNFQIQVPSAVNQNLSFLDETNSSGMEFWDLLPDGYMEAPTDPNLFLAPGNATNVTPPAPPLNMSGVDFLGSINFDEPGRSEAVSRDLGASLQRYMAEQVRLPQGTKSSTVDSTLSSDRGTSAESLEDPASTPPPSMRPVPTINCSCLSSLFLALDSLSRLPPEVIPAMRVARNACKVAHDVINCPRCSIPLLDDPNGPPPIQSFQSFMFLGTLVPSACNAYATILEMIDTEMALAKQHQRTFWFSLKEIGGLWGDIAVGADYCSAVDTYNDTNMAPDMWRMVMRAILRLDVYGLGEIDDGIPHTEPYSRIGLRDVVRLLEERTRQRHEILDALFASGQGVKALPVGILYPNVDKPCPPEERNCTKILETARVALENLVIA